jgi:hypothetical protein
MSSRKLLKDIWCVSMGESGRHCYDSDTSVVIVVVGVVF